MASSFMVGDTLATFGIVMPYLGSPAFELTSSWQAGQKRLISFIRMIGRKAGTPDYDDTDANWKWLKTTEAASASIDSGLKRLFVFYNYLDGAENPLNPGYYNLDNNWVSWLIASSRFNITQASEWCLFQGTFAGSAIDSMLGEFGFSPANPYPPTFLLDQSFAITDRWTLASPSNAHSDTGVASGTLFYAKDLILLPFASLPGDDAKLNLSLDFVRARAKDLATATATISWDGTNPVPGSGEYWLKVKFPGKKVVHGWDSSAYDLKRSGSSIPIDAIAPIDKIDAAIYIGSSPASGAAGEFRTLHVAGALCDGNYTLIPGTIAGHILQDTKAAAIGGSLSFTISSMTVVSPLANSSVNTMAASYTLAAALQSGTISWTRTGGAADPQSPHVHTLSSGELTAGSHSGIAVTGLVNGTVYSVVFSGLDASANAVLATIANVTFDTTAPTIVSATWSIA